jgi:4-hydroxythreonine-4-phosphate dehydrogenase
LSVDYPPIVVSSGEPAGIGPDICLSLAAEPVAARLAVLGDPDVLGSRLRDLAIAVQLVVHESFASVGPHRPGVLSVLAVPVRRPVTPGRLDAANAEYVLALLRRGVELCQSDQCRALVTAPVQKSIINEAGIPFTGHTEFLAELTAAPLPVMMLASENLRVALVTTHLPLRKVADAIDRKRLESTLQIIERDLRERFGISAPRIRVLGLNPHAGESGALGMEEITVIEPAIRELAARGMRVSGPYAADTAFTRENLAACDVVLAMYHDQGLPVIKALSFGEVVNVTLGLPMIRTSVDHGTALSLAGTRSARHDSLREAVELALRLARHAAS